MSEHQVILDDSFWKFLVSLEELKDKKDKALFCSSLNLDEEALLIFQNFLNRFNVNCLMDDNFIYPLKEKCRVQMEFSLSEWFALQATFQGAKSQECNPYFHKIIQNKMLVAQKAYEQFNLYKKPVNVATVQAEIENLKKKIDYNICYRKMLNVVFHNNKDCIIYPLRLVFLDGILCVIGENYLDKTLVYFGVEDIDSVNEYPKNYEPNLSQIEINEFINHLRLINGKDERLILKIYSQYETDLLPSFHFLGNPFVTSNPEGDMIWAATIEMCDDIFLWLYSMKDRMEILDPGHIRKEFSHFCELKKQNDDLKKAS